MLLFDQTVELIMWIFNYTLSFEQPVSNYWFKPPYVFDSLKRTTHLNHSFENQSSLYVSESQKRTNSLELLICKSSFILFFLRIRTWFQTIFTFYELNFNGPDSILDIKHSFYNKKNP